VTDRSPWGENVPEPDPPPTAELLAEAEAETRERIESERTDQMLWERFAHRLTADGNLIR